MKVWLQLGRNYKKDNYKNKEERNRVQYLFLSVFGDNYFEYKCVHIFVFGENLCPNFNLYDYAMGFEYMEYEDRYIRFLICFWDSYSKDCELILKDRLERMMFSWRNDVFCIV